MQPLVISYLRFSKDSQANGDSIRRQTSLRDAYLTKKNLVLDDSLTIRDLGVSAYRGKNLKKGALAVFIQAVEAGKVPKGSILIIEKLDRFSRDDADEALYIFTRLIKAGITIVTLDPEKEWNAKSIKGFGIMELVLHFILANEESEKKSARLGEAWREKKRKAQDKKPITKMVPTWLEVVKDKIVPVPAKVAIVKRIFKLVLQGHGTGKIAKQLNQEKIPAFRTGEGWHSSTVGKLLRGRQVLGEYQPCRLCHEGPKRRVPVGEPIEGYYPQAISDAQWLKVQAVLDSRRQNKGNAKKGQANLFTGILKDARDGGQFHQKRINRSDSPYLIPARAMRGMIEKVSFHYPTFEYQLLRWLHELDPKELIPSGSQGDDLELMKRRLSHVEINIEKIKTRMQSEDDISSLLDVLKQLEDEKKTLVKSLPKGRKKAPKIELEEIKTLQELLKDTKGKELVNLRTQLKELIRSLVDEIQVLIQPIGNAKVAFCQVHLRSGATRYIDISSSGQGTKTLGAVSFVGYGPPQPAFDLRLFPESKQVQALVARKVEILEEKSPQRVALKRVANGEKPYKVAADLGIANSTVYRWVKNQ